MGEKGKEKEKESNHLVVKIIKATGLEEHLEMVSFHETLNCLFVTSFSDMGMVL